MSDDFAAQAQELVALFRAGAFAVDDLRAKVNVLAAMHGAGREVRYDCGAYSLRVVPSWGNLA